MGNPGSGLPIFYKTRWMPDTAEQKTKKRQNQRSDALYFGARYRTRTCDLLHVKQMLYQLS